MEKPKQNNQNKHLKSSCNMGELGLIYYHQQKASKTKFMIIEDDHIPALMYK